MVQSMGSGFKTQWSSCNSNSSSPWQVHRSGAQATDNNNLDPKKKKKLIFPRAPQIFPHLLFFLHNLIHTIYSLLLLCSLLKVT